MEFSFVGLQFKKKRREFGQFLQKLPVFWTNFIEYFLVSVSLTQYVSCLSVLGNALTIPIVGPFLGVRYLIAQHCPFETN